MDKWITVSGTYSNMWATWKQHLLEILAPPTEKGTKSAPPTAGFNITCESRGANEQRLRTLKRCLRHRRALTWALSPPSQVVFFLSRYIFYYLVSRVFMILLYMAIGYNFPIFTGTIEKWVWMKLFFLCCCSYLCHIVIVFLQIACFILGISLYLIDDCCFGLKENLI